ncbi:MAG: histidine phosphatase family protein [Solirubrobacteraceae bacterium]|nr:histidine phosphatase family protein [Solirubrobacteraceae bacterium]
MTGAPTLLLARHGETADNAERRFQGSRNPPLNARGREQAAALAQLLRDEPIAAIYASPLLRAAETAEIVSAVLGLPVTPDDRLREIDVGDWTGRSYAEVFLEAPGELERWAQGDLSFRFPGGESLAEQAERVVDVLEEIRSRPEVLPALVVCHGGVIRVAQRALGRGVGEDAELAQVGNGTVHPL